MSFKSGIASSQGSGVGFGRRNVCSPLKWLMRTSRSDGASMVMSAAAHAASAPHDAGQISPLPRALAPIAAGNAPATVAIDPSRASSPSTQKPSIASRAMAPTAAINPSAIGRS